MAEIARQDRVEFFGRHPRYATLADRLICTALCQGAAQHFVDGANGVKDFDVWTFYGAHPDAPAFPWRRLKKWDFGDPKFGRSPDMPGFVGRRVDLLGRSLPIGDETTPDAILHGYLSEGRTQTARALSKKAAVLLEPADRLGSIVWPPGATRTAQTRHRGAGPPDER